LKKMKYNEKNEEDEVWNGSKMKFMTYPGI
jgi:hypothetical protein